MAPLPGKFRRQDVQKNFNCTIYRLDIPVISVNWLLL